MRHVNTLTMQVHLHPLSGWVVTMPGGISEVTEEVPKFSTSSRELTREQTLGTKTDQHKTDDSQAESR